MASPDTELQGAIFAALKASAEVMALVHDVYDDLRLSDEAKTAGAPYGTAGGYISFGPESSVPDDFDCLPGDEITVQIDVWSNKVGRVHCKAICGAVRGVLKGVTLSLPTHAHVVLDLVLYRVLPDPQEGITHGVMQFEALVEEGD